jgi:glucose 1-dehydrogenase
MTEFVVDSERNMHIVPPEPRDVAVLTEPLTIAEKAKAEAQLIVRRLPWLNPDLPMVAQTERKLQGDVLGAGPVGLLGAFLMAALGGEIYVYALPPAPNPASAIVEAMGATYVSKGNISEEQRKALLGNVDMVYEATGVSSLAFEAWQILGPYSTFIFTGVPGQHAPAEVDTDTLMRNIVLKNQVIMGSVNASPVAFDDAITDLGIFHQRWPGALRAIITSRSPVEDAHDVLLGKTGGIKNVISFAPASVPSARS